MYKRDAEGLSLGRHTSSIFTRFCAYGHILHRQNDGKGMMTLLTSEGQAA